MLHGAPDASGNPTHRVLYALSPRVREALLVQREHPEQLLDLPLNNPEELIQVTGAELIDSRHSRVRPLQA